VRLDERASENPVMTFSIKKRIDTELFIGRTAALFKKRLGSELGPIRVISKFAQADWRSECTLHRIAI